LSVYNVNQLIVYRWDTSEWLSCRRAQYYVPIRAPHETWFGLIQARFELISEEVQR